MPFSRTYLSGLLCLSVLPGMVLSKPQFIIPLTVDSDLRYQVKVNMSSTAPQTLSFGLTTGMGYTVVAGTNCTTCGGVKTYDESKSQSAQNLSGSADVSVGSVGSGTASGSRIKEDCALYTKSNSAGWQYKNQTIIVASKSDSLFSDTMSGIIGLGRNRESGDFSSTVYSNWLSANTSRTNFTYGMALKAPYTSSTEGGDLHWLGIDENAYSGDLTELSTVDTNISDWTVTASGWSFQTSSTAGTTTRGDVLVVLDPYESDVFIPSTMSRFIYSVIPGSTSETPSSGAEVWTVPCGSKFSYSLLIGQKEFRLTEKELVHQIGDKCHSALRGWTDAQRTHLLLGSAFISSAYIVFTINKSGAGTIGFGLKPGSSGIPTSTIIAIVIGCVAFTLSAGIIVVWFFRRRIRKQKKDVQQTLPDPYRDIPSAESRGLLAQPSPTASPYTPHFDHLTMSQRSSMLSVPGAQPGMTYAETISTYPVIHEEPPPEYESGQRAATSGVPAPVILASAPPRREKGNRS